MNKTTLFLSVLLLFATYTADAALHDRGEGLIYDDSLNITWLQNANYTGSTLTWEDSMNWANDLVYNGFSDWRLPDTDINCSGKNCLNSEMGYLYSVYGISSDNPGIFNEVKSYMYWSGTENEGNSSEAWRFNFKYGTQDTSSKTSKRYAWAVRDGDSVPPVAPEPVSSTLFLSGGAALICNRLKRKR